jgi:2-alkenal reductase
VNETDGGPAVERRTDSLGAEDLLLFKVCVAAIWSDGSMAAAERDHLSHLMDRVAATERERNELRRIALHDVSRSTVLAEIDELAPERRRRLYERCIMVLAADRRLRRGELRFVAQLRRRAGVGLLAHEAILFRASPRRRVLRWAVVVGLAAVAVAVAVLYEPPEVEEARPPRELTGHPDILLPQVPVDGRAMGAEELFERIRASVVKVNVLVDGAIVGHGSGAVLGIDAARQLYVLTNRHVVYHEVDETEYLSYEIQLENGVQLPAMLDFYSRQHDLAVVTSPGLGGWGIPAPLRLCRDLHVGTAVWAVGSPIGLDHSFTSGVVSALRGNMVQTDATVHSGSSGGPLFDDHGRVCGVITTSHLQKDFSFALCGEAVLEMLDERFRAAEEALDAVE